MIKNGDKEIVRAINGIAKAISGESSDNIQPSEQGGNLGLSLNFPDCLAVLVFNNNSNNYEWKVYDSVVNLQSDLINKDLVPTNNFTSCVPLYKEALKIKPGDILCYDPDGYGLNIEISEVGDARFSLDITYVIDGSTITTDQQKVKSTKYATYSGLENYLEYYTIYNEDFNVITPDDD